MASSRKTMAAVFYKANKIEASVSCKFPVFVWSYSEMDQSKNAKFLVHLTLNITARLYLLFTQQCWSRPANLCGGLDILVKQGKLSQNIDIHHNFL